MKELFLAAGDKWSSDSHGPPRCLAAEQTLFLHRLLCSTVCQPISRAQSAMMNRHNKRQAYVQASATTTTVTTDSRFVSILQGHLRMYCCRFMVS
ncbi:hypothetical protein HBI54_205930 [Parastagonospora nodorum]|nr:hypothetical protein HBI54_205930 [Parastagonospora nodorum]